MPVDPCVRRVMRGVSAVLACSAFSPTVSAEVAEASEVLITASRVMESSSDAFWSSTVLTREDIERSQATSMQELLERFAGVSVNNNGGMGKATSVFLRGTESDHTLLLVDGVRVGSATLGIPPYELIPIEQIERIELVRGPRSTLYGSDAIGGVIQIFTRRSARPGLRFGAGVEGGSHQTRRVSADLQARGERTWIDVSAETYETDGINACVSALFPPGGGCFADEPDRDGFQREASSLAVGYELGERLSVELRGLVADGSTEFDGSFSNEAEFAERVASLQVEAPLGERWSARAILGRNEDVQDNFSYGAPAGSFKSIRESATLQVDGPVGLGLRAVAGVDHVDDEVESDTLFTRTSRAATGLFTEINGEWGPWSALAGARLEDNEQFGSHVTTSVGAGRTLGGSHRLTATWGTAFRAPTFNELYFPGFGNPALEPEESSSLEIGVDGSLATVRWSLHVYQTEVEDLIAFDSVTFAPQNIAQARIRGAELQAGWRSEHWQVNGQLTRMDPENRSGTGPRDLLLNRRPEQSGSLEVRRTWRSGSLGTLARWEGRRYDDLANTVPLGGYFTLDLTTEQSIGRSWKVLAKITNALDREYTTAAWFTQDGRSYSLALRYAVGE